jgi:hypothetical protein
MTDTPLALTIFHEDWWPNAAIKGDKDVADLRSRGHVVGRLSRGASRAPDDPRTDGAISMASEFPRYSAVQRLIDMIPWYAKIAAKILLSRLPISYDLWRRANLFRHGAMDVPQHALEAVRSMIQAAGYENRLDGSGRAIRWPRRLSSMRSARGRPSLSMRGLSLRARWNPIGRLPICSGRGYPHRGGQTRAKYGRPSEGDRHTLADGGVRES